MRKVWGLYSRIVDPYHAYELIELFEDGRRAAQVRDMLIGKPIDRWGSAVWEDDVDDPEYSDLLVIEMIVR